MKKFEVKTSKPYEVIIGRDFLKSIGEMVSEHLEKCTICIVTDDSVEKLYFNQVNKSLRDAGYETIKFVFKNGEASKNTETLINLVEFMAENNMTRHDAIVALGGGVVGDISGFGASTFLRGIKFIQVPTTVLAAVDSSVGGKTAVDLKAGKNLFGTFYQPTAVLCDIETFNTLPKKIYNDGISEIIKYGVICDAELPDIIDKDMIETVSRCVSIKADIVSRDEFDTGERQLLNLGHTLGHAVERLSNYSISHGSAVAIGMALVTRGGEKIGITEKNTLSSLLRILEKYDLPTECQYSPKEILSIAQRDKKSSNTAINLIIPKKIGQCIIYKMDKNNLYDFISLCL